MTLKRRATAVLAVIVVGLGMVVAGLHFFADNGQFAPASATGGATKADQRDAAVSNDVANHKGQ